MKKSSGFTLIELLAVIALIALLALVVVPSVINLITGNKDKLDSTTTKLIYTSAENYLDYNQTTYIKGEGAVYCITFQELIDKGFLEKDLKDITTNKTMDELANLGYRIKSTYVKDLFKNKYEYEILIGSDECTNVFPLIEGEFIAIGQLNYYREIENAEGETENVPKDKVYNGVEMYIKVPVVTSKVDNNTQLTLKIRRGKNYINDVFEITGGIVNNNSAEFLIKVPSTASVGEYVIEVIDNQGNKATKNLRVYINPIILFMGE